MTREQKILILSPAEYSHLIGCICECGTTCLVDLAQKSDPGRMLETRGSIIHTLSHGLGILLDVALQRPWHLTELWAVRGFPDVPIAVNVFRGTCQFDRNQLPPISRTYSSQTGQVGNTMHVGPIGSVKFYGAGAEGRI